MEFVRTLIDCAPTEAHAPVSKIRTAVDVAVEAALLKGNVQAAAVMFRDLETGRGFTIQPQLRFNPASLLKLPMAMGWMRLATFHSEALDNQLTAKTVAPARESDGELITLHNPQLADAPVRLEVGKSYSVLELLGRSIIESDNDAAKLIGEELPGKFVQHVFDRFDLPVVTGDDRRTGGVQSFGRMFISLFNATYNTPEASEHLLRSLSRTRMKSALVAGVPKGTVVAHKFGVDYDSARGGSGNELHDCGIIYRPGGPYMLCVMARGAGNQMIAEFIASISTATWRAMDTAD